MSILSHVFWIVLGCVFLNVKFCSTSHFPPCSHSSISTFPGEIKIKGAPITADVSPMALAQVASPFSSHQARPRWPRQIGSTQAMWWLHRWDPTCGVVPSCTILWSLRGLTFTQKWRNREGFDQNKMVMVNKIFPNKIGRNSREC